MNAHQSKYVFNSHENVTGQNNLVATEAMHKCYCITDQGKVIKSC